MPFVLFPLRVYQIGILLLAVALAATGYHRAEHFDDAWFAEQSYWLIREGKVRSELFRGLNGWEDRIYVFHKLFVYAGALVMSLLGISVATSKLVSIFFGVLGGWLIGRYNRHAPPEQRLLAVLLYVGCGALIRQLAINRPETMCMALGFGSFMVLDRVGSHRPVSTLLAGVLAGLAALTHLNGLIYLIAGAGWLFIRMGWRAAALFGIAGGLTLSLYVADALLDGNVAGMIGQFRDDPATQQNLNWVDKLTVMADYHQLFFHNLNEAALSVLFLLCLLAFRRQITLAEPGLLYVGLLFVSFWLITKSATYLYFILFLPWLVQLTAGWFIRQLPNGPAWQRQTARVLVVLYSLVAFAQVHTVVVENYTLPDVERQNALLAAHMPHRHAKVIAPIEFFFGQMDNYTIRGLTYYHLLERKMGPIPLSDFFNRADRDGVAYIISDHRLNASYNIPPTAPARIGVYKRIYQDKWNSIYERR